MVANTSPVFVNRPLLGLGLVSAGNVNRDGTGTLVTLLTAGPDGARVDRVTATAIGVTTAGMLRLFVADDAGTPNIRLVKELPVTAVTPSASVAGFAAEWVRADGQPVVDLPPLYSLRAATHNAESFHLAAQGGNYTA